MTEAREVDFGFEVSKGVVAQFAMAVFGFVGIVLFARILGPVEFGGFYLLMTLVKVGNRPVIGLAISIKKRLSERDPPKEQLLGTLLAGNVGVVTMAALVAFTVPDALISYTGLNAAPSLFVIMFTPLVLFASLQQALDSTARVGTTRWIDFARSVFTLPAQLALVLAGLGATGMAYGEAFAAVLVVPVTAYALGIRPAVPTRETVRLVWSFAKYSIPTRLLGSAYEQLDMILIGILLTSAVAGDYQVALKLTLPAVFISSVAGAGLMSRVSNLADDLDAVAREISNTVAFASVLAVPIFFGALAIPDPLIVTTYGSDYSGAAPLLIGLTLYRLVRTQAAAYMQALSGLDRQDAKMRITGATLAFNIVVGVALVFEFGVHGIVVATVLAEGARYVGGMYLVRKQVPNVTVFPTVLRDQFVAGVAMFGTVEGLHLLVPVKSWAHLGFLVGGGALVYGGVLVALSDHFRRTAESIMDSMKQRIVSRRP